MLRLPAKGWFPWLLQFVVLFFEALADINELSALVFPNFSHVYPVASFHQLNFLPHVFQLDNCLAFDSTLMIDLLAVRLGEHFFMLELRRDVGLTEFFLALKISDLLVFGL